MFSFQRYLCLLVAVAAAVAPLASGVGSYNIMKENVATCVGTVIKTYKVTDGSKQSILGFIVTTAHCVRGVPASKLQIGTPPVGNVDKVIIHPFYKPTNVDFDVALLKVKWTSTTEPEVLPQATSTPGPNEKFRVQSPALQQQESSLINWKECQRQLGTSLRLSTQMLCASVPVTVPDGSALVVMKDKTRYSDTTEKPTGILGVAFFGGKNNQPRVFMNITHPEISAFIDKYIKI